MARRYLLEERVASGTMGEVWRASDTRRARTVAVKLLHADLSESAAARVRFKSEATVVAALNSPQIATVYEYGEEPDGDTVRSYLVMEWIKGRSLAELLTQKPRLHVHETVRVITEAAEALHAAHVAGIVHRDVKPGNILITNDFAVKLIDFGIASARDESTGDESGKILGTLAYLSPEQITHWRLTPGVDVYALGIVAYECLAGAPPFGSDVPAETLAGHLSRTPAPLPPRVPEPIAEVILKAIRKRAVNRWQSAAEFASALREAAATPPPAPTSPATPTPEPAPRATSDPRPKPGRRRMTLQLVGLITVLALIAVAVLLLWPSLFSGQSDQDTIPDQRAAADSGTDDESDDPTSPDDESSESTKSAGKPGDPASKSDEPSDDPTSGDDDPGGGQTVPDLKGTQTYMVEYTLQQHGYENSSGKAQSEKPGEENCVVTAQSPSAGTEASPSTTIIYYYRAPVYGCGNESRISSVDYQPMTTPSQPSVIRDTMRRRYVSRRGLRGDRPRLGGEPVSLEGAHRIRIDGRGLAR
ncbi:serine/threonine protein kinase [Stackebrandtia nassauensis DSM 44728]|uniref:non-specific serine/threonine protein kinase n=1 Tax=Stackebrandtia nassauensis (strain DSM 44728 / CIP 108903 / NRRL B-16338 / NBRC 102104 / LLR-40K-21) TaxID=446470 RepID=D3Q4L0_STANL|nr:serine/threonine protein kinase [Stackebrandtia nassauensis DSM 44728]